MAALARHEGVPYSDKSALTNKLALCQYYSQFLTKYILAKYPIQLLAILDKFSDSRSPESKLAALRHSVLLTAMKLAKTAAELDRFFPAVGRHDKSIH